MRKKRIISSAMVLIVLCALLNLLTGCSQEEKIPIPEVKDSIYIYDEDNIIDDDVEAKLNSMLVELEEKTEVEFAIVSVPSLLNRSIESYANNLFNTLGIGKKGKDNGVLLLFSRSDVKVRLEIGRGLEGCLNDAKCGRILDTSFVTYRESDEYTKATELTAKAVLNVIAEEYEIDIEGLEKETDKETESQEDSKNFWKIFLLIVIIVFVILVIIAIFSDGSSDGYSGGYHGGGFSGGFGGGFGGGFSGGGGASR